MNIMLTLENVTQEQFIGIEFMIPTKKLYNTKIQKEVKEEVEDIECFWEIWKNGREYSCSYDFPKKGE